MVKKAAGLRNIGLGTLSSAILLLTVASCGKSSEQRVSSPSTADGTLSSVSFTPKSVQFEDTQQAINEPETFITQFDQLADESARDYRNQLENPNAIALMKAAYPSARRTGDGYVDVMDADIRTFWDNEFFIGSDFVSEPTESSEVVQSGYVSRRLIWSIDLGQQTIIALFATSAIDTEEFPVNAALSGGGQLHLFKITPNGLVRTVRSSTFVLAAAKFGAQNIDLISLPTRSAPNAFLFADIGNGGNHGIYCSSGSIRGFEVVNDKIKLSFVGDTDRVFLPLTGQDASEDPIRTEYGYRVNRISGDGEIDITYSGVLDLTEFSLNFKGNLGRLDDAKLERLRVC